MARGTALLLLLLVALAAVACGGGSDSASPTPSSSSAGAWSVTGQVSGTPVMTSVDCSFTGGNFRATISGMFNGKPFSVFVLHPVLSTPAVETNLATDIALSVSVLYAPGTRDYRWAGGGVGQNVGFGPVTLQAKGDGSMNVTLPPSLDSESAASAELHLAGAWTCPGS